MLASVMPGVVSANFWRDLTFFTCIPAAVTAVTLLLFTSAKTSTFFPVAWILCLPFSLILSPRRSFPLRWCFSFAKAMRDVYAHNVVRISCKHCDQVSFVIWTEPAMNGPTTDKLQRFPIGDIDSYWTITNRRLHESRLEFGSEALQDDDLHVD